MVRTYALLLFLCLGFCPHCAVSAQRTRPLEPPQTPILPAEQAWLVSLPFPAVAPAVMDDARVYIPLEGEHFIAIDRETGATAWTVDIESVWPPLVLDGVVVLAASDELHALDAATGMHRWRVSLGRGAMAPMAFLQDLIVVLVAPDEVWAYRPSDGHRLWGQSLGGHVGPASMTVTPASIFVALGSRLVRVELIDGTVRWDRTLTGTLMSPAASRDRVFVGSTTNDFYAFDPEDGSLEWKWRFGGDVIGITSAEDLVFVASLDNIVRAVRRGSGSQIWKRPLTTRPTHAPRLFENVIAIAGPTSVSTLNAATGAAIGNFDAPGLLQGVPAIDATPAPYAVSIVAVTRDGRAIGLRPTEMMFKERVLDPLTALPGRALQREVLPGR